MCFGKIGVLWIQPVQQSFGRDLRIKDEESPAKGARETPSVQRTPRRGASTGDTTDLESARKSISARDTPRQGSATGSFDTRVNAKEDAEPRGGGNPEG